MIFITHNSKFIKSGSNLLILDKENNNFLNNNADNFLYSSLDFEEKLIDKSSDDRGIEDSNSDEAKLLNNNGPLAADNIYKETKKSEKVQWSSYKRYISFGGGLSMFIIIVVVFIACHVFKSYTEKLISHW